MHIYEYMFKSIEHILTLRTKPNVNDGVMVICHIGLLV